MSACPIIKMKCLYISFIFFAYNYVTWGQDLAFPTSKETTMITEPVSKPNCPQGMILYPGESENDTSVCDCKSRFLYFPLNDSCHEAYRQGPCPPNNYVALPKDEVIPRCVENPCLKDGMVQYNGTCYLLNGVDGPCAKGIIGVNETTLQLECIELIPFTFIVFPERTCPPGSRRSTQGVCKKV